MRILVLSNFYPPAHLGGLEQYGQEVVDYLRSHGHSVQVLTSRFGLDRVDGTDGDESIVERVLYLQSNIHFYNPLSFFLSRPFQERANKRMLLRTLERFQPDLVFIWGMWDLSPTLLQWCEEVMPGRVVYSLASYWLTDQDIHLAYWELPARRALTNALKAPLRRWAKAILRRANYPPEVFVERAMCCSQYVKDRLVAAGKLSDQARVIYISIDPTAYLESAAQRAERPEGPVRLVYLGSLVEHKGVHTAIQALGILKKEGSLGDLDLTLVGGGHPAYEAELHRLAEELGVADRVHFLGRVEREKLPALLNEFDISLFCSTWEEPLARAPMEAMAAGLLLIGTPVGGQSEMLFHGENSLTFPVEDAATLAARITQAVEDPELRQRLAQAGQQTVLERFNIRRVFQETEEWLEGMVA